VKVDPDGRENVRRADPAARRRALRLAAFVVVIGAGGVLAFGQLRVPLKEWILADPSEAAQRVALAMSLIAVLLVAPLFFFAAYLWSIGNRTLRAQEFPPPGRRVSRDTRVMVGEEAISRARQLKLAAMCCGIGGAAVAFILWRLASMLIDRLQ